MASTKRKPQSYTSGTATSHNSLSVDPTLQLVSSRPSTQPDNHSTLDCNTARSALDSSAVHTSSPVPDKPQQLDFEADTGSRRHSYCSMRNSVPYEGPPSTTPTGRVSKAKKGKRVHTCEFPGCGKVFSRAEHRRRHELNHNPEALFRCNRQGCRKAFHRSDLLQRHYERHDLENGAEYANSHLRPHSSTSMTSGITSMSEASRLMPLPMNSPPLSQSIHRSASSGVSIPDIVHPNNYALMNDPTSFSPYMTPAVPYMTGFPSPDNSSFYTPRSSQSPAPELYAHYPRPRGSSTSSVTGMDPSIASPMLSAEIAGNWVSGPPSLISHTVFDDGFDSYVPVRPPTYLSCMFTEADQTSTESPIPISLSDVDEHEWSAINRELSVIPRVQSSNDANGLSGIIRWYCLEYYWQYFHPFFPIIHRPTFLPTTPSPLLSSAMVAIGSVFDRRADAQFYTLTLLEVATKLLRKRETTFRRPRLADLQTVFLLEVLSKYCSRSIEVEMSPRFRMLYATLNQSRQILNINPLAVLQTLGPDRTLEDLQRAQKVWVEHESRRRILQASMVLDMQQMTLFEQPPAVIQRVSPPLSISTSLPTLKLPCAESLWSSSPVEEWSKLAQCYEYADQGSSHGGQYGVEVVTPDCFQLQVRKATQPKSSYKDGTRWDDESPAVFARFNDHATELAQSTPVRCLLIVSGQGWLYGWKLENDADVEAAKQGLREWVSLPEHESSSCSALWHALQLLKATITITTIPNDDSQHETIGVKFKDTHMLHEQWCLYLAALVCWAHGSFKGAKLEPHAPGAPHTSSTSETLSRFAPNLVPSIAPPPPPSYCSPRKIPKSESDGHGHFPLMSSEDAARSVQKYLQATTSDEISRPSDVTKIQPTALSQFHGLLEVVRLYKIAPATGGLMREAEKVLYNLVEGKTQLSRF